MLLESFTLRGLLEARGDSSGSLRAPSAALSYEDALRTTALAGRRGELLRKSVALVMRSQLACARAMIELDGLASRLVICPPDFDADKIVSAVRQAQVEAIVADDDNPVLRGLAPLHLSSDPVADTAAPSRRHETEWVLPTSGTTGAPKLVAHRLAGLLGAIKPAAQRDAPLVWATFYDIRRYGGLQIFLRAVTSGATLILSDAEEPIGDHAERLRAGGATHITGTPSHWRRLLMSPHIALLSPEYVRLSGEIADRAILDSLHVAYPKAAITHAYASTEAGVGFEVTDGREGFPASFIREDSEPGFRVADGSLRIRSARTAHHYVGRDDLRLRDDEGFVDTDDRVELRGDRYYFQGRGAGVINIGGLKVHPEEVEQVINAHDEVRVSLVKARRNPIIGDLIVADVVLKESNAGVSNERRAALRDEILSSCRARLERHKAPAMITFVDSLEVSAGGKLARRHA